MHIGHRRSTHLDAVSERSRRIDEPLVVLAEEKPPRNITGDGIVALARALRCGTSFFLAQRYRIRHAQRTGIGNLNAAPIQSGDLRRITYGDSGAVGQMRFVRNRLRMSAGCNSAQRDQKNLFHSVTLRCGWCGQF